MPEILSPSKALPCPFCSRLPDIDDGDTLYPNGSGWKDRIGGYRSYHRRTEVPKEQWCYGMNCTETSGGCGAAISGDSAEEALAKWNRRPG
jgi:hypothetical protein